ncbi:MAG TPA: iron-containing alcohol dehydrogenase, partial [Ruminiclostridium sp.]
MNKFELYIPTIYAFGYDVENEVGARCLDQGATKVLIHYGGHSAEKSGLLNRVRKSLTDAKLSYTELSGVKPNPRMDLAYKGIEMVKTQGIDFILAIGGGSVIDSAKCIAAGSLYDGDAWDFYNDKAEPTKAIKLGCILTIPAAGSEGSKDSVMQLIDKDGIAWKRGTSGYALYNSFALLNPELTWTLPTSQTAAGCADIFTHVTERYFTNTEGTYLIDNFCESILRTIRHYAPLVIADPKHKEAREQIMWAGTMAHNNICGVGRI